MSAPIKPRRPVPDRVRVAVERKRSGAAGFHGCRTPRKTADRRAIATSMAGE